MHVHTLELQSHDSWKRFARLDPISGAYEEAERSEAKPRWDEWQVDGVYQTLDGHFVAFYRYEFQLWLRVDDETVVLGDAATAELAKHDSDNELTITASGQALLRFRYRPGPQNDPANADWLTPMSEPEDFDIALFIANVLRSLVRKRLIWRHDGVREVYHRLYFPDAESPAAASSRIRAEGELIPIRILESAEPGWIGKFHLQVQESPPAPPANTAPSSRRSIASLANMTGRRNLVSPQGWGTSACA